MLDVLSQGFKNARLKIQGKTRLTEESLAPALREVRTSLIQADVDLKVAKDFLNRVQQKALGEIVPLKIPGGQQVKVTPADWFIKACYDELVELMGPVDAQLDLEAKPSVIMLVGLQGSGKTTTAGKLAKKLLAEGKKPLLVAADIYRPAAVEQLMVLGQKLNVPVFSINGVDPVKLSSMAVAQAKNVKRDVVIIDTAGRLAIDDKLMNEVEQIRKTVKPQNVLFVCDAMIGQDAVRTAKEFDRRLDFTGFVLTKLDGDARGGAALSIKAVTGKPIKFLGEGEALDRLEEFRPEGLAQRILGFGDVVGLMKDFEKHVDQESAERDAKKMLRGEFSYHDFVKQLNMIRRMGSIRDIMGKMPGISQLMDKIPQEALDDRELDRTMAVIQSMTKQERNDPDVLDESRFERIALGCGRDVVDVRDLHQRFLQARQMMAGLGGMLGNPAQLMRMQKQLASGGGPGGLLGSLGSLAGGLGAGAAAEKKPLTREERLARRKKQKDIKKSRKRNRK